MAESSAPSHTRCVSQSLSKSVLAAMLRLDCVVGEAPIKTRDECFFNETAHLFGANDFSATFAGQVGCSVAFIQHLAYGSVKIVRFIFHARGMTQQHCRG